MHEITLWEIQYAIERLLLLKFPEVQLDTFQKWILKFLILSFYYVKCPLIEAMMCIKHKGLIALQHSCLK